MTKPEAGRVLFITFAGVLLAALLASCAFFEETQTSTPVAPAREIEATVNARVAATLTREAVEPDVSPEPNGVTSATGGSAPAATANPTPSPTATRLPTPRPTPTPIPLPSVRSNSLVSQAITTSLGQKVQVVVRGFDNSPARFDQLIQAIDAIEDLIGAPYPSPSVEMVKEVALPGGFCGHNQMSYAPRYEGNPLVINGSLISLRRDRECDDTFASVVHEVAHTWFHGAAGNPANWIDEGLANAMENQLVALHSPDKIIYPPVTYCGDYSNIAELEESDPSRFFRGSEIGYGCHYSLGDGIFGALREHYGDDEFNRLAGMFAREESNPADAELSFEEVRVTFGADGRALEIIDLWYSGEPEMRKYRHLDAVDWGSPPVIDGEYLHFSGTTDYPETVLEPIVGKDEYCSQFSLYSGTGDLEWVANVADPLPAGWHHNEVPKAVIVDHAIDPEVGSFEVTAKINDLDLSGIQDLSLRIRSRVTVGEDGLCETSVAYSQVPVTIGAVPGDIRTNRHYSLGAIRWIHAPTVSRNTLRFAGKASPGAITLDWSETHCSQFKLYARDVRGYHYIDRLSLMLPAGRHWTDETFAEITGGRIGADGAFTVTASLRIDLSEYRNPVLLVSTRPKHDRAANRCGASEVLSAADINVE